MATLKFLLRSDTENSNIFIRFSNGRGCRLIRKTGYIVNYRDWNKKKNIPNLVSPELKNLKLNLDRLKTHIESQFNISLGNGEIIDNDWLLKNIDLFNNKRDVTDLDILTNYIQKYIDDAPYKINQKGSAGLSSGRVMNIKLFKNTILRFQREELSNRQVIISKVDVAFIERFKSWLMSQNYSINYVGKNIDNFKTICNDASKNGYNVNPSIKFIKRISEDKNPENIITLSKEEQFLIKNARIDKNHLNNARKWLLLGCQLGQRGSDLLSINESNFSEYNGMKVIEIKQGKTGKLVTIPLLPEASEVLKDGLPHKISLTRFNDYIKDVCKLAGLKEVITGKIKVNSRSPMETKTLEKYNFITTHVCRRSFATNFYGDIPTAILINITGHGSEKVFLKYIGKSSFDYAVQMHEAYLKLYKQNDLKIIS